MFDWLIVALGGYTEADKGNWDTIVDSWRARCIAAETSVELFKEIMTRERERSEKLEEKLVGAHPNSENQQPPNLNPVGDRRLSSWPRIRRELEKQSRVKDNAEVSREEIERTIRERQ